MSIDQVGQQSYTCSCLGGNKARIGTKYSVALRQYLQLADTQGLMGTDGCFRLQLQREDSSPPAGGGLCADLPAEGWRGHGPRDCSGYPS